MQKTIKGDINEININIENVMGGGLVDLFGLASGAKKAAYCIHDEKAIKNILPSLKILSPEKKFYIVDAPERKWIKKLDGNCEREHFFVGEDKNHLLKLKKAFDKEITAVSHQEIGILLSYPPCCANRLSYTIDLKKDFLQKQANEINFLLNNFFLRSDSNLFLYSFYPCSYDCKATKKYVKKIYQWLKKFPKTRKFIEERLKMPVMFFFPSVKVERGVGAGAAFGFNGKYKDKNTLLYDKIYYAPKGQNKDSNLQEKKDILNKMLDGNKIYIREGGFDVYNDSKSVHSIENERIVFFWPK